jgi:hypothetical protein
VAYTLVEVIEINNIVRRATELDREQYPEEYKKYLRSKEND